MFTLSVEAAKQLRNTQRKPEEIVIQVASGRWGDIPIEDRLNNEAVVSTGKGKIIACIELDLCDPMLVELNYEDNSADIKLLREAYY